MEKEIKTQELEMIDKKIEELENELAKSGQRMEQYKRSGVEEQYAYESSEYDKIVKQIGIFNELKNELNQILSEMDLDYETEEDQINGILENMQKELRASGDRMKEYKKVGAEEQYAYEFSEYSKISDKINNYVALKKEYDDITIKKEEINSKYDLENIDNKIKKLENELKSSAIRMSEYKSVGSYEQYAYENSYYSQIVSEINELKGVKEEAITLDEKKAELIKKLDIREYHTEEEQINTKISELQKQLKRAGEKMKEFNDKGEEENYVYAHKEYNDITRQLNDITRSKEKYDGIKTKYNELLQPKKSEKKETVFEESKTHNNTEEEKKTTAPNSRPNGSIKVNESKTTEEKKTLTAQNSRPNESIKVNESETIEEGKKQSSKEKKYKITIGTSGKIEIDGKTIKINSKTIKYGAMMNSNRSNASYNDFLNVLNAENYPTNVVQMIKDAIDIDNVIPDFTSNVPFDFTVIHSINEAKIDESDKKQMLEGYLKNVLKSHYEFIKTIYPEKAKKIEKYEKQDTNNDLEVIYDMKDLSKPLPFLGTLLARYPEELYLNGGEKEQIVEYANKAYRYGVGKTIGQYKYNDNSLFAKILSIFKKDRKLLPEPKVMQTIDYTSKETIYETSLSQDEVDTANIYNTIRDKSKAQNRNIREVLKDDYKEIKDKYGEEIYNKTGYLSNLQENQEGKKERIIKDEDVEVK